MRILEAPRDVSSCEDDVVNTNYSIQSGCDFLLIDRDTGQIIGANQSLIDKFENPTEIEDVFTAEDSKAMRECLQDRILAQARFYELTDGSVPWAEFFATGQHVGVEFTEVHIDAKHLGSLHRQFANTMSKMETRQENVIGQAKLPMQTYLDGLAQDIRDLTGFDRAMIYRFDSDLNGEVVSEVFAAGLSKKFIGLKFPSGDIPAPARKLFLQNRVRQIIDVSARAEAVIETHNQDVPIVFDQTQSSYRFVAPVHRDYLENMGVKASLVIGLVVRQQLWGLISCHHEQGPRRLDPTTLTLCQVASDLASNHIAAQLEKQRADASKAARKQAAIILREALRSEETEKFKEIIAPFEDYILGMVGACGAIFRGTNGRIAFGHTPSFEVAEGMNHAAQRWMDTHHRNWISSSDLARFNGWETSATEGFGGMTTFRTPDSSTSLQFFRNAEPIAQTWAGDPDAKIKKGLDGTEKLTPRGSFKAYSVMAEGCSRDWDAASLQAGREFHRCLHDAEAAYLQRETEHKLTNANRRVRAALARANFQAMHDPLTGLSNRRAFESYMDTRLKGEPTGAVGYLCHLDVDHFKHINDTYGHAAGDEVLLHLSQVMTRLLPRGGHVARIGGDEFTVVMPHWFSEADTTEFCATLRQAMSCPIYHLGHEIITSCTIGIARFNGPKDSLRAILARSDLSLYRAKAAERGTISIFSLDLEEAAIARRKLEQDIERGLEEQAFVPYFQPQIDSATGKIAGLEVLARWHHPERGILLPAKFFEAARQMNAMREIDQSLFNQAISTQRSWSKMMDKDVVLSLNISVERLIDPVLVADLKGLGDAAELLTLELLETIYLDDPTHNFEAVVKRLRKTGVGIEVDDFGSGRTSILAVASLRPDRLKIDRRLVEPVPRQKEARELLKSILQIGEHLGISSVAEGVETEEHVSILRDLGCERLQGYHLGRPMTADKISKRLAMEPS